MQMWRVGVAAVPSLPMTCPWSTLSPILTVTVPENMGINSVAPTLDIENNAVAQGVLKRCRRISARWCAFRNALPGFNHVPSATASRSVP